MRNALQLSLPFDEDGEEENLDQVAELENRFQEKERAKQQKRLALNATDIDSRASYEVTADGTLRTGAFIIRKTGFRPRGNSKLADSPQQKPIELSFPTSSTVKFEATASLDKMTEEKALTPASNGAQSERTRVRLDINSETLSEMEELGRGAGGKVIKCLHIPSNTIIALKCIDVSEKAKRSQLIAELSSLDKQYSPYFTTFYGAFYDGGLVKLGLEYMNRGSLQAIIHKYGPLNELVLSNLTKQSLQGLNSLHSNRKLHRDIKPGNLLANDEGFVKVSDFGILADLDSAASKCDTFVGTTCYMSPERLSSEAYGYPADIWSLGLSLITMATGTFPLSTADGYWGLLMALNSPTPPRLPTTFSPLFQDFVERCLVREPAKRWSARELLEHDWILQAPEREEALTMWPKGLDMAVPDEKLVKILKEKRLQKIKAWEEKEKKRERRNKRKQNVQNDSSTKAEVQEQKEHMAPEPTLDHEASNKTGNFRQHRRKQAVASFIPVGLAALKKEMDANITINAPKADPAKSKSISSNTRIRKLSPSTSHSSFHSQIDSLERDSPNNHYLSPSFSFETLSVRSDIESSPSIFSLCSDNTAAGVEFPRLSPISRRLEITPESTVSPHSFNGHGTKPSLIKIPSNTGLTIPNECSTSFPASTEKQRLLSASRSAPSLFPPISPSHGSISPDQDYSHSSSQIRIPNPQDPNHHKVPSRNAKLRPMQSSSSIPAERGSPSLSSKPSFSPHAATRTLEPQASFTYYTPGLRSQGHTRQSSRTRNGPLLPSLNSSATNSNYSSQCQSRDSRSTSISTSTEDSMRETSFVCDPTLLSIHAS